jgi:hypothetical protein
MAERGLHDLQVASSPVKFGREPMAQRVYGDRSIDPGEIEDEPEPVLRLPRRQPPSL